MSERTYSGERRRSYSAGFVFLRRERMKRTGPRRKRAPKHMRDAVKVKGPT